MIQLHPKGKPGPQCSLVPRGPVEPDAGCLVRPWRPLHTMRPGFPGGCSVLVPRGGLTSAPSHCGSPAPGSLETHWFCAHERAGAYRSRTSQWRAGLGVRAASLWNEFRSLQTLHMPHTQVGTRAQGLGRFNPQQKLCNGEQSFRHLQEPRTYGVVQV